jgi:hypothetical protein
MSALAFILPPLFHLRIVGFGRRSTGSGAEGSGAETGSLTETGPRAKMGPALGRGAAVWTSRAILLFGTLCMGVASVSSVLDIAAFLDGRAGAGC